MGLPISRLKSESLECLMNSTGTSVSHRKGGESLVSTNTDFPNVLFTQIPTGAQLIKVCSATLVDCQLRTVCKGRLVLRTSDLLFIDGTSSMTWPLWSLRWYGENACFFVFESGHRCPSGPGLFLFKSKQSRLLRLNVDKQIDSLLRRTTSTRGVTTYKCAHTQMPDRSHFHAMPTELWIQNTHCPSGKSCGLPDPTNSCKTDLTLSLPDSLTDTTSCTPAPPFPPSAESESFVSYSLMIPPLTSGLEPALGAFQEDGFRNAESSDTESPGVPLTGQYLIAAAPHAYVNQPNLLLLGPHNRDRSEVNGHLNDYVVEPTDRTRM